jgi:hypothetical protein
VRDPLGLLDQLRFEHISPADKVLDVHDKPSSHRSSHRTQAGLQINRTYRVQVAADPTSAYTIQASN